MRYRLQRKEPVSRPCIIGNSSMPLPTYRWKDIAASDNLELLRTYAKRKSMSKDTYRIEDTEYGGIISLE